MTKIFFICAREYRQDYRRLSGYTVKMLNMPSSGRGRNRSTDWTGLDEAIFRSGPDLPPPPVTIRVTPRQLTAEEREALGRTAHRNWVAVRTQQRAAGAAVDEWELREWDEISEDEKELFRRGGDGPVAPAAARSFRSAFRGHRHGDLTS